ncbi:reprolysin-like metallopeptidase [Pseudomonas sp. P1.8]|uniref:reprolysin-like metallopeptidase n=2 Tax=unclassified Pseudomonas TaxID=196821 RepID=UPI00069D2C45|nr:hypothetical protein [Pseudomonas sp. P1.8]
MKKPISIMIVIHRDLYNYQKNDLYADYFSWLKSELESLSGRDIRLLMYRHDEVAELSGYNYRNEDSNAALQGWTDLINDWFITLKKSGEHTPSLTKVLLLTRNNINVTASGLLGGTRGISWYKGHCAIAAITSTHVPAHEIGHMLGAKHEDSEVIYDGWWHDTIMLTDEFSSMRGNAHRYSDKNRENIRNYLDRFE